jgi:hypothetical protein
MMDFPGYYIAEIATRRDLRPQIGLLLVVGNPHFLRVGRLFVTRDGGTSIVERRYLSGVAVPAPRLAPGRRIRRVAVRRGALPWVFLPGAARPRLLRRLSRWGGVLVVAQRRSSY